jgi:CheY-like chemotaxis protein
VDFNRTETCRALGCSPLLICIALVTATLAIVLPLLIRAIVPLQISAGMVIVGSVDHEGRHVGDITRILVVDDFHSFRAWVSSVLQNEPLLQVIAEASDGLEAVQRAQTARPDLIILDVGLPELNGLEAARIILKALPNVIIVFLSQECSVDVVSEAIRLGALGYVAKVRAGAELLKAIQTVLQGKRYLSQGLRAIS